MTEALNILILIKEEGVEDVNLMNSNSHVT